MPTSDESPMTNPLTPEEREAMERTKDYSGLAYEKGSLLYDHATLARAVTRLVEKNTWLKNEGDWQRSERARLCALLEDCWAVLTVSFEKDECDLIDRIKAELGPLTPPGEPTDSQKSKEETNG